MQLERAKARKERKNYSPDAEYMQKEYEERCRSAEYYLEDYVDEKDYIEEYDDSDNYRQ